MKKISPIFIFIILFFASCSKSNTITPKGTVTIETRLVDDFNSIIVSSDIELILSKGNRQLTVETHENVQKYIEATVKDSVLTIKPNYYYYIENPQIKANVSTQHLQSVTAMQSSLITVTNTEVFNINNATINLSGSSEFNNNSNSTINSGLLNINVSGRSKLSLHTAAKHLKTEIKDFSSIQLYGLADTCEVNITGNSDIFTAPGMVTDIFSANVAGNSIFTASDISLNVFSIRASNKSQLITSNISAPLFYATLSDSCSISDNNHKTDTLDVNLSGGATLYATVSDSIRGQLNSGSKIYYKGTPGTRLTISEDSELIKLDE